MWINRVRSAQGQRGDTFRKALGASPHDWVPIDRRRMTVQISNGQRIQNAPLPRSEPRHVKGNSPESTRSDVSLVVDGAVVSTSEKLSERQATRLGPKSGQDRRRIIRGGPQKYQMIREIQMWRPRGRDPSMPRSLAVSPDKSSPGNSPANQPDQTYPWLLTFTTSFPAVRQVSTSKPKL